MMQRLMRILPLKEVFLRYDVGLLVVTLALLFLWPELRQNLFASDGYVPHYHCYLEKQWLVLLHLTSDFLIGCSYVAISLTLAYLVHRARRDIPFHWIFLAFGLFIIACGSTHFMEVWTLWTPVYWLSGYIKLITAVASVATALVLPPLVPKTLALIQTAKLSEEHRLQLQATNEELEALYKKAKEATSREREAEAANRLKDEFLATLSHELRTPLTPIIGWVHMMREGILPVDEFDRGLAAIDASSHVLARLINDLLDMSAILSDKMRIERSPIPLDEVIKEAVETVGAAAARRKVNIEIVPCDMPEPVLVSGDRTRLVQVFWNLLDNAVKFSGEASRVRVLCELDAASASIRVEDEGQGITPEFLPHVFERFRQADSSSTRAHGGLGVGLALVQSFVAAHGGSIAVESQGQGRGSRFTVSLPRIPPAAAHAQEVMRSREPVESTSGLHALIVEDAPETLSLLQLMFEARGYRTTLCESAAEALRLAPSLRVDVIVSDIGMPEIDGLELITRLRQIAHMRNVPAVALTGYATPRDMEDALAAGFDAHIAKPIDPSELLARIERLLKER